MFAVPFFFVVALIAELTLSTWPGQISSLFSSMSKWIGEKVKQYIQRSVVPCAIARIHVPWSRPKSILKLKSYSRSKIVYRLRSRKYNPIIIKRTIGLVLGPSTTSYRSFLKHCTLTNKAAGTIWRDLSSEETNPWSSSYRIVSQDSFSPWICARLQTGGA